MDENKKDEGRKRLDRALSIFFRGLKGEKLTAQRLADEYNVATKSIHRSASDIRTFLADNRDLVGNSDLVYDRSEKCYILKMDDFLQDKELLAVIKILIGSRAFGKDELLGIINKLKKFVSTSDRELLETLIQKEKYHYCQVKSDCDSVIDNLWRLAGNIKSHREITITYYKMNRDRVEHRIRPVSILFSEYYFYLVAYKAGDKEYNPIYFRVDRIIDIVEHRVRFELDRKHDFDEGELRKKIQFMFPGKCRTIRFEFTGPSYQAILDRLPTAVIVDKQDNKYIIEADVYGDGIKMFLLSQGSWVKVISPQEFVKEMRDEVVKLHKMYM